MSKKIERYTGDHTRCLTTATKSFARTMIMTTDHRKTLPHVWGTPHQHYVGEFRSHVWRIERDDNVYWLFTSVKGTSVEWDTRGSAAKLDEFSEWLYRELREAMRIGDPGELAKIENLGELP